mmetsp:Transcript_57384/g.107893  ORF Transcript_57384/g.107893 Transcript_57384/m.107893 type:complete len:295 (-) Transcript_57384:248-1132(-)
MTDHYQQHKYDELAEVTNEEAFDMCLRLNQEESLIAGPSSGLQVVGALRLMKDEPGNVGVVIFCDDVFKYTTSVTKHCPKVFPTGPGDAFISEEVGAMLKVLEHAKDGPDTLNGEALSKCELGKSGPKIIDVRPPDEFETRLRPRGAVNLPLSEITGQVGLQEQVEQVFDVPGAVQRKVATEDSERSAKRPRTLVHEAVSRVLGADYRKDEQMLLICNRGIDSLFAMLALKASGFTNVKDVGRGMFAWREMGLPTESGCEDMPPAKDAGEEALLEKLGYTTAGKPKEVGKTEVC